MVKTVKKDFGKLLSVCLICILFSQGAIAETSREFSIGKILREVTEKPQTITIPQGRHRIRSTVIPKNIALRFQNGAMLEVPKGERLEINGPIEAGRFQIFTGDGSVSGDPVVNAVYPEWFGAGIAAQADASPALQKAIDFATSSARINRQMQWGENIPRIDLGKGVFHLSKGLVVNTLLQFVGDGAVLQPLPGFPEREFALSVHLLKIGKRHTSAEVYISGLRFGAFSNGIYIDTNNADRSSVIIERCRFHNIGEQFYRNNWADKTFCSPEFKFGAAIYLDSQSSLNRISDCFFNVCHRVLYVEKGDYVLFNNSWISTRAIIQGRDIKGLRYSPIVNKAYLIMRDIMGIPQQRGTPEKRIWHPTIGDYRAKDYYPGHPDPYADPSILYADQAENAWIANYKKLLCDNVRFGGEYGGFCAVNNFARWNKFNFCSITILNSSLCHEFNEPTIRLFEIPFSISMRDNTYLRVYMEGREFEAEGKKHQFKPKLIDFAPSLTAENIERLQQGKSRMVRKCNAKITLDNNPPEWYLGDLSPRELIPVQLYPYLQK